MAYLDQNTGQFELLSSYEPAVQNIDRPAISSVSIAGRKIDVTPVFSAYWYFAAERQRMFFKRLARANCESLTNDPVLAHHKFTNAYRASDRVSQYLIKNVIYRDDLPQDAEELFFRIMLFKLFNKIETWEALEAALGALTSRDYSYADYDAVLTEKMSRGERIYSAAYIMPSAGRVFGQKFKHQNHLHLLARMIDDDFPGKLHACDSMAHAYSLLLSAPSFGPFLAYQYVTDINYSELTNFGEKEFVVAGPGALDGIAKCFKDLRGVSTEQVIQHMCDNQTSYFEKLGVEFPSLWGRPLQLIDCQNLFCEISKYARVAFPSVSGVSGRTRIKQKFAVRRSLPAPWYPPKWGINDLIDMVN